MHPTLIPAEGVDFVYDDGLRRTQHSARSGARHDEVKRFRSGDQDVRWLAHHPLACGLWRVTGAHRVSQWWQLNAHSASCVSYAADRLPQVARNVIIERFQGRDIQ